MRSQPMQVMALAVIAGVAVAAVALSDPLRERTHGGRHHSHGALSHGRRRTGAETADRLVARAAIGGRPPTEMIREPIRDTLAREPARSEATRAADARACHDLSVPDVSGRWVSRDDLGPPIGAVRGDDLLAIVNRSPRFSLDPHWAPDDLVDLATGAPAVAEHCNGPSHECLRHEAADALGQMLATMSTAGMPGWVHSAFRSFHTQCGVFRKWAYVQGEGFCGAATSSALAGHSQHQLGTALDLFTVAWARGGVTMRPAFGCTPGGRWLADHAYEYGFVLPYPLPVDGRDAGSVCALRQGMDTSIDPRTGYTYEPWHLRYIGADAAARFHAAWLASGVGTGSEITLEQWLRREHGIAGDADLPACDGCSCGLCATFHHAGEGSHEARGPCVANALELDADGEPVASRVAPRIVGVTAEAVPEGVRIEAVVQVPSGTVTQTPAVTGEGPRYVEAMAPMTLSVLDGGPPHAFPDLPHAWRLAAGPGTDRGWPWRVALRSDAAAARMDAANLKLPANEGRIHVVMIVPRVAGLRVALIEDGRATDETVVTVAE